jgi:hypothetical protein
MSIISSAVTMTALPCRIFSLISAKVFLTLKLFKSLFRPFDHAAVRQQQLIG